MTDGRPPGTVDWKRSVTELGTGMRSYYGRPVIKEPVWQPAIPWYFFTGGLGGASSVLGRLARDRGNDQLADAAFWIAFVAESVSPLLLISDLGRPERFHHMFRVFKVTSPMSVGSWILGASGTASGIAAAAHVLGLGRVRDCAERVSAALGLPLASYTAVLLSDTSVSVWHEARRELPLVFTASSAARAGAAASIVASPAAAGPARRTAIAGTALTGVAMHVMERRLGFVGEPYRKDAAGRLRRLAEGLNVAGAAVLALAGRRRPGAHARRRGLPPLVGLRGGVPVGARPALHRRAAAAAGRAAGAAVVVPTCPLPVGAGLLGELRERGDHRVPRSSRTRAGRSGRGSSSPAGARAGADRPVRTRPGPGPGRVPAGRRVARLGEGARRGDAAALDLAGARPGPGPQRRVTTQRPPSTTVPAASQSR